MQTVTHKTYKDVLQELAEERRRMAEELAQLCAQDPDLLLISPRELQLVELAGYVVDLRTGTVEKMRKAERAF